MGILNDLQKQIDDLGFIDTEINSKPQEPVVFGASGKEEYEWYNNQIYTGGDRRLRFNEYEDMNSYAEIASALDIYADDATQKGDDGRILKIFSADPQIKEELELLFFNNINIESNIWNITRSLCMYGENFSELILSKDKDAVMYLKSLPPKTMWRIENNGYLMGFVQQVPNGAPVHIDPFHMVHWRLPTTMHMYNPYGTSVLESSRRAWRQLKLMEDAMVVYRVTRAPERRVFNIDTGNLPPAQAEAFVERQKMRLKKRSIIDRNGNIDYRSNILAPDEDYFIGKRNGSEGTTIDTLQGAQNLGEVDDVKYFKDKIFAALKIPRIYLQDPEGQAESKQNVSQQDIMFARTVERVQNHVIEGLKKVAIVHLILRGYKKHQFDNFEILMTPPSDLRERMSVEMRQSKAELADRLVQFGYSKEYIVDNLFDIPPEEWKDITTTRYKEKVDEAQVDQGQMPGEAAPQDAMGGDTGDGAGGMDAMEPDAPTDDMESFTDQDPNVFEQPKVSYYSKFLNEGELQKFKGKKDVQYLKESFESLQANDTKTENY